MRLIRILFEFMEALDKIDRRILRELKNDGRLSNVQLAERINMSPSACLRRVQELEKTGVIKGYRAVIDPARVGRSVIVFVSVGLDRHRKQDQTEFEQAMNKAEEVVECHNISGNVEYLLRVEVESLEDYKRFHTEVLGTVSVVSSIVSHFAMGCSKDERG